MRAAMLGLAMAAGAAGGAHGATMTFEGGAFVEQEVGGEVFETYVEDGITARPDRGGTFFSTHLDPPGGQGPSSLTFTAGGPFRAVSLDIGFAASDLLFCEDEGLACLDPAFDYGNVVGFRNGVEVIRASFNPELFVGSSYLFGEGWGGIDALVVGAGAAVTPPPGYSEACEYPCYHFGIGAVVLAPVPLPASGLLLAFGLIGLAGAYRLRR